MHQEAIQRPERSRRSWTSGSADDTADADRDDLHIVCIRAFGGLEAAYSWS